MSAASPADASEPTRDSTLAPKPGAQCASGARGDLCTGLPESVRAEGGPYRDPKRGLAAS